jgi:hypothetical protein
VELHGVLYHPVSEWSIQARMKCQAERSASRRVSIPETRLPDDAVVLESAAEFERI